MHILLKTLFLFASVSDFSAHAEPLLFQKTPSISSQNIKHILEWFTRSPHPMGTPAQKQVAHELAAALKSFSLVTSVQEFVTQAPSLGAPGLSAVTGYNVVAHTPGVRNCAVILSGHYDTKYFKEQRFVGANDGGSSTALLVELARVATQTKFSAHSLGGCSLYFVFFDGEEALLPDWNDGNAEFKIQDNLYGSRAFVAKNLTHSKPSGALINGKKLEVVLVLDMIGHKDQNLFITQGSDRKFADKLIAHAKGVNLKQNPIFIDDDHLAFINFPTPVLHIIDWTNLAQWHKSEDTLEIVAPEKIAKLGEGLLKFMGKANRD